MDKEKFDKIISEFNPDLSKDYLESKYNLINDEVKKFVADNESNLQSTETNYGFVFSLADKIAKINIDIYDKKITQLLEKLFVENDD